MKRLNIIALLLMSLVAFVGCDDDKNYLKLNEADFVKPVLQLDLQENIIATSDNLGESAGTWQWTTAGFGVNSEVSYQILIDTDRNMENAQEVILYSNSISETPQGVTKQLLNASVQPLLPEGVEPEDMEEMTFYLAVKAFLGTSGVLSPLLSDPVEFSFTPFPNPVPKGILYAVGDGLVGWDNLRSAIGDHLQVLFADDSRGTNLRYTYTAYFAGGGGLKFPTIAGDWATAYAYQGGVLSPDNVGDNFPGPAEAGVYTLSLDLRELSVSIEEYEGEVVSYERIGIVGDAVGSWDNDQFMTKVAEHVWVAKNVELQSGALKFRANASWDVNWGSGEPDFPMGQGAKGADNISIEAAGTYFVSINSLTGHYIIIPMEDLP